MFTTLTTLKTPRDFEFWSTVWCTYWCALHPFHFNENDKTLTRIQKLTSEKIVKATLKLLGRYDFLALDTWLRRQFAKIHNQGKPATDKQIEEWYATFGEWKGLVMWLDMVKDFLLVSAK